MFPRNSLKWWFLLKGIFLPSEANYFERLGTATGTMVGAAFFFFPVIR